MLRAIKNDDRLKSIPAVILTSSREEKDLVESYKLGVNAYVVKPVVFQQFIEAVKSSGPSGRSSTSRRREAWEKRSEK